MDLERRLSDDNQQRLLDEIKNEVESSLRNSLGFEHDREREEFYKFARKYLTLKIASNKRYEEVLSDLKKIYRQTYYKFVLTGSIIPVDEEDAEMIKAMHNPLYMEWNAIRAILQANEVTSLDEIAECLAIESPYQVVCKLGEGKAGRTYKVYSHALKRYRALKIIDNPNPKEAQLMARLSGGSLDNIVQIHEAGEHIAKVDTQPKYAIVMEYVDGNTLEKLIHLSLQYDDLGRGMFVLHRKDRRAVKYIDQYHQGYNFTEIGDEDFFVATKYPVISFSDAIEYSAQILNGIIRLREHGITHRDLNLRNIMVTPKKEVKILDFGIATDEEHPPAQDNRRFGAPASMEASDLISLGLIVYKLYTYKHLVPVERKSMGTSTYAETIAKVKETIYNQQGKLRRGYVRKIPKYIKRIVVACLECRPIEEIKQAFLETEPSVEYYFMQRHDLIARILEREREMLEIRKGMRRRE